MEIEKKRGGRYIKNILMVMGTATLVGYLSNDKNRNMVHSKALKIQKFIVGLFTKKKNMPTNENNVDRLPGIPKSVFDRVMK